MRLPARLRRPVKRLHDAIDVAGAQRRLDDLARNQSAIAAFLALVERADFAEPCAGPPLQSRTCTQADCGAEYAAWLDRMGVPLQLTRKYWEWVAIARALEADGMLAVGRRGVGFGVGREPLVAALAGAGCEVVATDLPGRDGRSRSWSATEQHASSVASLQRPEVCDPELLAARVRFRAVDMNDVPGDLTGFDFCWSSCALEHLGSLENGAVFVERSLRCLRPGGLAVHTTEYNLDEAGDTIEEGDTVVYRSTDIAALRDRLAQAGHHLAPCWVGPPTGVLDWIVGVSPGQHSALRVRIGRHLATSAVLVIRAAGDPG